MQKHAAFAWHHVKLVHKPCTGQVHGRSRQQKLAAAALPSHAAGTLMRLPSLPSDDAQATLRGEKKKRSLRR